MIYIHVMKCMLQDPNYFSFMMGFIDDCDHRVTDDNGNLNITTTISILIKLNILN